jgi:hypothetical protein
MWFRKTLLVSPFVLILISIEPSAARQFNTPAFVLLIPECGRHSDQVYGRTLGGELTQHSPVVYQALGYQQACMRRLSPNAADVFSIDAPGAVPFNISSTSLPNATREDCAY